MNQNGFFLTLSAFVIATAILFFNSSAFEKQLFFEQRPELIALQEAGQKYRDIQRTIIDLDLEETNAKKRVLERGLPFSYEADQNRLFVSQYFPVFPSSLATYFTSLNGFRIFFLEKAREDLSPDFALDINTARDANWGGNATEAGFLLFPFCAKYGVGEHSVALVQSTAPQCLPPFDPDSLQRADINFFVSDAREDFNRLVCNGAACPQDPFDPGNPNPFFSISFETTLCPHCSIAPATISTHFPAGSDYNVFLSCNSPSCESEPLQLLFNNFFVFSRDTNKAMRLEMELFFDENISSFQSTDFNYSIRVPRYGIVRTNNPTTVPS